MVHGRFTYADGIHPIHSYVYADSTARTAATGFLAIDVGKVALQESDSSFWVLTDHSPATWVELVAGTTGITELTGDVLASGPGSAAASVVKIRGVTVAATSPSDGEVLAFDAGTGQYTPTAMGGGGGSLQDAYDAGPDVVETLAGGISLTQGSGSPLTTYVLKIAASLAGGSPVDGLYVVKAPAISASGAGINVSMNANTQSPGVYVAHAGSDAAYYAASSGSGAGVFVYNTGSGDGITVNGTSGTGDGITVQVADNQNPLQMQVNSVNAFTVDGTTKLVDIGASSVPYDIYGYGTLSIVSAAAVNPIQTSVDGENAFTVDGTNFIVDIGTTGQPIDVIGYRTVRMGTALGTTTKSFEAYTTNTGSGPSNTNNLGRMLMRPGVNSAASTAAELAVLAGSAGEVLITKGGYVYSKHTLIEYVIENGTTLAAGDVVGASSTAGRVTKATASNATSSNVVGICLVGGTGTAGSVYCLVAQTGAIVGGFTGLTTGAPVYLDASTAGLVTATPPTSATTYHVQVGYAINTTDIVVIISPRDPAGVSIRATSSHATLAETDYVLYLDCSGGNRTVTLPPVKTNVPRPFVIKKYPGGDTNKISLICAGSETIEGGTSGAGMDLPDSTSSAAVGPSWTLMRDASGNWVIL